jgi:hypothetical protein
MQWIGHFILTLFVGVLAFFGLGVVHTPSSSTMSNDGNSTTAVATAPAPAAYDEPDPLSGGSSTTDPTAQDEPFSQTELPFSASSSSNQTQRQIYYTDGVRTGYVVMRDQLYVSDANGTQLVSATSTNPYDAHKFVDGNSFEALSPSTDPGFFKDKNHVYFSEVQDFSVVPLADPATFHVIHDAAGNGTSYGVDEFHVFDENQLIPNADPVTFKDPDLYGLFTYDADSVWCNYTGYGDVLMNGASGATFIPYSLGDGSPTEYGHDATTVYCCDGGNHGSLAGADINTFTVDSRFSSHDKDHAYIECSPSPP